MDVTAAHTRKVLSEYGRLSVSIDSLSDEDDLFVAGMTSHAILNVMLALEDAYDIEFPEPMLRRSTFCSVTAIEQAVRQLVSEGGT